MTICIAAIAKENGGEHIVFSTDHMVTTPTGQFEHSIIKYKLINGSTVAMLAGDPLIFDDLVKIKSKEATFEKIKNELFQNFKDKRKEIIKNAIFDIYGIDEKFFIDALRNTVPNMYINGILEQVSNYRLGTGILLIGFDEEGKARIAEVNEEKIIDLRDINFHAIGSGGTQAVNTLLFQKHDKCDCLLSTIYNVYKAKANAEVMQGVGKETELLVLSKNGCQKINEDGMKALKSIYESELKFGKSHSELRKIKLNGM